DGSRYCGWQIQPNGLSVQTVLENSLAVLLRVATPVTGAGRTDAGVHAKLMVAHFDAIHSVDTSWLMQKLNSILPPDIAVSKILEVKGDAHARFDALRRTYEYWMTPVKSPFNRQWACRYYAPMDFDRMNEACKILMEYTDFTSFSKLHTDVKTNECVIYRVEWTERADDLHVFTIQANRFLRNMVRAITGTLIEVGKGKLSCEGFREVIEKKDRCAAGSSMPAHALYLTGIEYDKALFLSDNSAVD
ncbi:MAG: tRNA pseudouridine(38-40) synthase TruA, partial [Bacteroidales bacterium]|nr:tRNA pseudouridine(38-40) synthase TruA [Bacteroidales bacterium]